MFRHFLFTLLYLLPSILYAQQKDSLANSLFGRKYKAGDVYRYRLTTESWQNGKWQGTTVSVCELKVVTDSAGIPRDEVKWISKKEFTQKDTIDKSPEASQVLPYRISLHPHGKLDIPQLKVASMTGEITDFNTFFVAVSPKLGIAHLNKNDDQYTKKDPLTGNFANGKDILKGSDCLQVSLWLQQLTKDKANIHTAFMPPAQSCLSLLTTDMNEPVIKDTANNFQMVRPFNNNKFNVLYGREYFYIDSELRRKDGKIMSASMINMLSLRIKLLCNDDYNGCQSVMPFTIERRLKLELLN